jgi:hypothetical protein
MKIVVSILLLIFCLHVYPQSSNAIQTAMSSLDLNLDPGIDGIGQIGCVSDSHYPGAGLHQNPALLSRDARTFGISLSYLPWSRPIINDIHCASLAAWYSVSSKTTIGIKNQLFDLGEIVFTNENGYGSRQNPYDLFIQGSIGHQFSPHFKTGVSLKYIRSVILSDPSDDLIKNYQNVDSYAIDLGVAYNNAIEFDDAIELMWQVGASLRNFGPKVKYTGEPGIKSNFLPTKIQIGIMGSPNLKINNEVTLNIDFAYQAEKFLVPSPPVYYQSTDSILAGKNPDISIFRALYQSFYDAPDGLSEEIHEIKHKFGTEFRISNNDTFYAALRGGIQTQHIPKGNEKMNSLGIGCGVYGFSLDFSYFYSKNKWAERNWMIGIGFQSRLDRLMHF